MSFDLGISVSIKCVLLLLLLLFFQNKKKALMAQSKGLLAIIKAKSEHIEAKQLALVQILKQRANRRCPDRLSERMWDCW